MAGRNIAICIPSRDRPDYCIEMAQKWHYLAGYSERLSFFCAIEHDDPQRDKYEKNLNGFAAIVINYDKDFEVKNSIGHKCNIMAEQAIKLGANIIITTADSREPINPFWDLEIDRVLDSKFDPYWLLDWRNSHRPEHTAALAFTTEWFNKVGYIYPEKFIHWYSDTIVISIAKRIGRLETLFSKVKDINPKYGQNITKRKIDSTHKISRKMNVMNHDKTLMNQTSSILINEAESNLREAIKNYRKDNG